MSGSNNKNNNTTSLNDLLERTRRQLSMREEQTNSSSSSSSSNNCNITVISSSKPSNVILPSNPQQQKLSNDLMTKTLAQEMGIPEPNLFNEDDGEKEVENGEKKSCLIDTVLERQYPPIMEIQQNKNNNPTNHDSIEGYIPKTTTNDNNNDDNNNNNSGNKKQQPATTMEQTTEIDINFTCMTTQEYKDTCQLAQSMGMTMKQFMKCTDQLQEQDIDEEEEGDEDPIPKEEKKEESKFISGVQFYHSDENNNHDNDDDDIFDFWTPNDDTEEEEEEEQKERPLRAFMIFWNALMEWMTPQAMDVLFLENEEHNALVELYDTSDVGASRCAGFLTMLKMNLSRSYKELHINASTTTQIQSKLTQWIRSFDFSRPMIKLSMPQWKAFTTILVQIVIISSSPSSNPPPKVTAVPPSVKAVDITLDEYIYLTQSAMKSLQKGSA